MFNMVRSGLKKLIYPDAVYRVRYGRLIVDAEAQRGVVLFVSLFLALWAIDSMIMSALGYDILTAMSAGLTCLANVGPGLGSIIGPVGNYSTISDLSLYLLSLMILLGRLEILTVLVLLTRLFWRR